jgi:hypothetical protein
MSNGAAYHRLCGKRVFFLHTSRTTLHAHQGAGVGMTSKLTKGMSNVAAYHRLCSKRVLFLQALHTTAMPIKLWDGVD